jgi:4a-hydroxytetrahydrobiopterin dehydratase
MRTLDEQDISHRLAALDGWALENGEITRTYTFPSFAEAVAFVQRVADLAEEADHHPDIDIRYDKVRLALSTHSAGGLTSRDFTLAGRIDGPETPAA